MKFLPLAIPNVFLIESHLHEDERGYIFESFKQNLFEAALHREVNFTQENQSHSKKGVVRGLHYQLPPFSQCKLVRVIQGEIFDVAVDVLPTSPTFGQWVGEILSDTNQKQMWIPEGFAHGYLTLSENSKVIYKMTQTYSPLHERSLLWNDSEVAIEWPNINDIFVSSKDRKGITLKEVASHYIYD